MLAAGVTVVLAASSAGWATAASAVPVAAGVDRGTGAQPASLGDPPGTWWYGALGLDEVHAAGATGEGVVVGLVDTVVDPTVPELAGADVVSAFNACRIADADAAADAFGSGSAADHGTRMASLIVGTGAGNGPTGQGTRGVAPDATVRVYARMEIDGGDFGRCGAVDAPSSVEVERAAFRRAIADGVDIINYSAGSTTGDSLLDDVLVEAAEAGVVVVAAVGNDGEIANPADRSGDLGVVAVAPLDSAAQLPPWSPRDPSVVVSAPGVDVLSGSTTADGWQSEGLSQGSSAATAVVSGALAVVKSRYPEATGNELVQHLVRHTTDDELRHDLGYGFGIVALEEMLASDPTDWHDVNPLTRVSSLPSLPQEYPDDAATDRSGPPPPPRPDESASDAATDAARVPDGESPRNADSGGGIGRLGTVLALVVLVLVTGAAVLGGAVALAVRARPRPAVGTGASGGAALPDTDR